MSDTASQNTDEPQASEEDRSAAEQEQQTGAETSAEPDDAQPVSGADDETGGYSARQPGADPEDAEEIEQERQERLAPENRPEHAEVDNSDRDFDETKGMFTDSEGYEQAEEKFPPMGEQGA